MPDKSWFDRPLLAPVDVVSYPPDRVVKFCTYATGKFEDIGCTTVYGDSQCLIVLRNDVDDTMYAAMYEHELAHCHAWPSDHPMD